jgi:hypothetical protein
MGFASLYPSYEAEPSVAALSPQLVLLPLLAFAKALRDRRSSCDQRSLVCEPLRKIGVILLHDIEYGFLGKPSMVLGKESVQVSELFVVHGIAPQPQFPEIYRNLLIPRQLLTCLIVGREQSRMVVAAVARAHRRLAAHPLTIC